MSSFQTDLLAWYDDNARVLPWRSDPAPYRVWVSEIMLQQTRVETVLPYFERFMTRFPSLKTLAEATEDDILRVWEGLGYYKRARNFHKAAQHVLSKHAGEIPQSANELGRLPGIGAYTAAAIASIAFGEPVAAVDGNIRRIYARMLALQEPLGSASFEKQVRDHAQYVLPADRPGDFNQALMDLSSTICLARKPLCQVCPVSGYCLAFQIGNQNQLPIRNKKAALPHYQVCAAIIRSHGRVLLHQRGSGGVLAGLWEFPGGKLEQADDSLEDCLVREVLGKTGFQIAPVREIGVFNHAYTHFKITVYAWHANLLSPSSFDLPENLRWVPTEELANYPMGKVARKISDLIMEDDN